MATTRVTANDIFPTGTLIGAYPTQGKLQLPSDAPPPVAPVATVTMADGGALLTGLDDDADYFVGGNVGGGVYRYVRISTRDDSSSGTGTGTGSPNPVVYHGSNAAVDRPAVTQAIWIGSVQPANLRTGDVFIQVG